MGERQVSVVIKAPPELVFGLYTDAERVREWLSGVREVRTVGPTDQPGGRAVMVYRVAGGPIGRVFDSRVGDEMVTTNRGDLARLKALAEEQAGIRRS